jgi:hypothetical protein
MLCSTYSLLKHKKYDAEVFGTCNFHKIVKYPGVTILVPTVLSLTYGRKIKFRTQILGYLSPLYRDNKKSVGLFENQNFVWQLLYLDFFGSGSGGSNSTSQEEEQLDSASTLAARHVGWGKKVHLMSSTEF